MFAFCLRGSHLQVVDIDACFVRHRQEAVEVGLIQEHVDGYASQGRFDYLFEDVHVSEDVHGDGNYLQGERDGKEEDFFISPWGNL